MFKVLLLIPCFLSIILRWCFLLFINEKFIKYKMNQFTLKVTFLRRFSGNAEEIQNNYKGNRQ